MRCAAASITPPMETSRNVPTASVRGKLPLRLYRNCFFIRHLVPCGFVVSHSDLLFLFFFPLLPSGYSKNFNWNSGFHSKFSLFIEIVCISTARAQSAVMTTLTSSTKKFEILKYCELLEIKTSEMPSWPRFTVHTKFNVNEALQSKGLDFSGGR